MEKTEISKSCSGSKEGDPSQEFQELLLALPKEKNWTGDFLYLYQGFWCPISKVLEAVVSFQKHFQAQDDDVILSSGPKSGTTWLKALIFSILNRSRWPLKNSPLLTSSPHDLVPLIEFDIYFKNHSPDLDSLPKPRIFPTHTPYASLPSSIKNSKCKIVYVCRNPKDQFISMWHFNEKLRLENANPIPLEEAFDTFCRGIHNFGPFWDHILGFWKASLERPDKVLFLTYEDLQQDIVFHTKRVAQFLGFPFSLEEEKQGVIEEITRLCCFENMKDLKANKTGSRPSGVQHSSFFRRGKVGDWVNYLTPLMMDRIEKLIHEKFGDSGLNFNSHQLVPEEVCV